MNKLAKFSHLTTRINRNHVQFLIAILALALMLLGIGAPADGGGATGAALRF